MCVSYCTIQYYFILFSVLFLFSSFDIPLSPQRNKKRVTYLLTYDVCKYIFLFTRNCELVNFEQFGNKIQTVLYLTLCTILEQNLISGMSLYVTFLYSFPWVSYILIHAVLIVEVFRFMLPEITSWRQVEIFLFCFS